MAIRQTISEPDKVENTDVVGKSIYSVYSVSSNSNQLENAVHSGYFIRSRLGEGAMGQVFLAEHSLIRDKKYAIKVLKRQLTLSPNFRKDFYNEAARQAQLSDPNIVQMYNYFSIGPDYFLVLEYVDGRSLADIIDTLRGPMVEKEALQVFKGVLRGLRSAHKKVIIHRDVKASNVMVDNTNRALLTDFGIAQQISDEQTGNRGRVIGTPEYMSPEQFIDPDKVDHRSDIYSAGILLFEMLTGQLPFKGASLAELKEEHINSPLPDPRAVNRKIKKRMANIIRTATNKVPDKRFQGAAAFLAAIETYERGRSWKIWALTLSILLATAMWYFVNEEAIQGFATTSATNYAFLCREADRIKIKEVGLDTARKDGDSWNEKVFYEHIREHNANMDKFAADYINALKKLSTFHSGTVRRVFRESEQFSESGRTKGEQEDSRERARFWGLARADYEQFISTGQVASKQSMSKKCPNPTHNP
ncbi:serine/threonine-protein kinase [Nitrosospira sp. Is2]|uniref:serine/threonine protein kinase n=1 Tax=Nitrosospira sp. Is2 TaxID=3080532 RepID=UPI0029539943|nr:serine/threonine-protein kinase [Nitrosospira sp. Is2]WON73499.1 serine/threonine-protein kinase [Nitrosospira sp. Is2]